MRDCPVLKPDYRPSPTELFLLSADLDKLKPGQQASVENTDKVIAPKPLPDAPLKEKKEFRLWSSTKKRPPPADSQHEKKDDVPKEPPQKVRKTDTGEKVAEDNNDTKETTQLETEPSEGLGVLASLYGDGSSEDDK